MTTSNDTTQIPYGYCQCGCGLKTNINKRNRPHLKKGEPFKYIKGHSSLSQHREGLAMIDKFWSKVNKNGSIPVHMPHLGKCWEWTAGCIKQGYGEIYYQNRQQLSHRVSWIFTHGSIENNLLVLHKCDNPKCVNPDHLFLGTVKDNSLDMVSKGRGKYSPKYGDDNPRTKLSDNDVIEIRKRYALGGITHKQLGHEYGVSDVLIGKVIRMEHRKNIP